MTARGDELTMLKKEMISHVRKGDHSLLMLEKKTFTDVGKEESSMMLEMEMIADVRKGDH